MPEILILKTGRTVESLRSRRGDFEDWFRAGLGLDANAAPCVDAPAGATLPPIATVPAVVVTGSPANATDGAPWSLACEAWLAALVQRRTPVLGVCYGHQILARALGGAVGDNPNGREMGTQTVRLTKAAPGDPLFAALPDELIVQTTHQQSVTRLPSAARLLAHNAQDGHQAFAVGECCWGLQFHPEFDADIVRGYAAARADVLAAEGLDPAAVRDAARDSPHGRAILQNFLGVVRSRA
ncbi:MAG: glutamine amidotransferase [Planctomycetota bacterium]